LLGQLNNLQTPLQLKVPAGKDFMKTLLFFAISIGVAIDCHAQSIFSIQKGNEDIAIIIGSAHQPIKVTDNTKAVLKSYIDRTSKVYIESRGGSPALSEVIEATRGSGVETMGEMIEKYKPKCLSELMVQAMKIGPSKSIFSELSPAGFMIFNVIPPYDPGTLTSQSELSIDNYIQINAIRSGKPIYEIEPGLEVAKQMTDRLNQRAEFEAAEKACVKAAEILRTKIGLVNMDVMYRNILDGKLNDLRSFFVNYYKSIGFTDEFMFELMQAREEKFFKFILRHLDTKEYPAFVFGAAHLGGDGLIYRLKANGFVVKPVESNVQTESN